MPETLQVIANPRSAGGKGEKILPRLQRLLESQGIAHRIHLTRAPGHGQELAAEITRRGAHRVLVVGGDGTFHEVANGVLSERDGEGTIPALALLPQGTGNDFHKLLRARGTLEELPSLLENGVVRDIDVGFVRWEGGQSCFINLLGVGIDVAVLRRRARFTRLPGLLQYLAALASALRSFKPIPVCWEAEEESGPRIHEGRTLLTAITVGPSVGGGFFLSPNADPEDGKLDLFAAGELGIGQVIRYLPGVLRGTLDENHHITRSQLRSLRLTHGEGLPMAFELDGELMPAESAWLNVEAWARALPVLDLPLPKP